VIVVLLCVAVKTVPMGVRMVQRSIMKNRIKNAEHKTKMAMAQAKADIAQARQEDIAQRVVDNSEEAQFQRTLRRF